MKEPQVLVTERAKLNLGSDSLRSKSSNQSVIDQVIEMLTAYVLKSDYNVDKAILNQQINDILSRLDNIPSMNIDDFLSLDSENPVQNKIITAALNAKPDKDTTYTAGTNVSIDSNNVISAVDTNYTAGNNVSIINNVISATDTTYTASDFDIKDLTDSTDLKSTWNNKQDQLTAGTNITIENNVISATGGDGLKQVDLTTYADGVEGEIVQHIGSTTNDYTHGYVYKSGLAPVERYEDVTIPAGSKCIVYTNKFDQSVKRIYSMNEIQLSKSVSLRSNCYGEIYLLDERMNNAINSSSIPVNYKSIHSNMIPDQTASYVYAPSTVFNKTFYGFGSSNVNPTPDTIKSIYESILSEKLKLGFRTDLSYKSIQCIITDVICAIRVGTIWTSKSTGSESDGYEVFPIRLSDLKNSNWDIGLSLRTLNRLPKETDTSIITYNPSGQCYFNSPDMVCTDIETGTDYICKITGGGGQGGFTEAYMMVSEDGTNTGYIVKRSNYSGNNYLNCLILSNPTSTEIAGSSWIGVEDLDTDIYFDYTATIQDTSEPITIHRKIQEYDEYGLPIDSMGLAWNRIDVQPANQLTAGDGITIEDNVISANLWTSVTD